MPVPITPDTAPLPPGVRLLPLNDAPPEARAILFPYHMRRQWRACLGMLGFAAASDWMAAGGGSPGSLPPGLDPRPVGAFGVLFFLGPRGLVVPEQPPAALPRCRVGRGGTEPRRWRRPPPVGAIEVATVEEVPGSGGEQAVLAFRFRPEDRDCFRAPAPERDGVEAVALATLRAPRSLCLLAELRPQPAWGA